ncbi:MAG: aldo/keto reductase [Oscillospiraceae bacterium]|nr:aldo/keto reductase [Oscillospiraceae bacterium]
MIYRDFAGKQVSVLGFGAMRFPTENGSVVEKEAIAMLRAAIDGGVNYIDTAYFYHGGVSETIVGKALEDGYRAKTYVATKCPVWELKEPSDFEKLLDVQLGRLKMDYVDFYMFHGISSGAWKRIKEMGLIERIENAKKAGKIGHIGFSFHDNYDALAEILDGYDKWEFCQIQLNYIDTEGQAGIRGLKKIEGMGIPVIIMEPLWGGKLANPPVAVRKIFEESGKSPVELAFDWLWAKPMPRNLIAISGMSTMKQVLENVEYAERAPETMDQELIKRAQDEFKKLKLIPCTGCGYCGCPNGVSISSNFDAYNQAHIDNRVEEGRGAYNAMTQWSGEKAQAPNCTSCGSCEELCPQHIKISEEMPKVAKFFS